MLNIKKLLTKILGAIKTESATPFTGCTMHKFGNVVCMRLNMTSTPYPQGWNTLGTLPEKFRPPVPVNFVAMDNGSTTTGTIPCWIEVGTNGLVRFYRYSNQTTGYIGIVGNIAYWGGVL